MDRKGCRDQAKRQDRLSETKQISVHVKFRDVDQTFSGDIESVWQGLNKFFRESIPSFEIAEKLALSVDLHYVAENCRGIIGFSIEGVSILAPRSRLTDSEILSLLLLASYLGFRLGRLQSDSVSRNELVARMGKNAKIVSTRLGELVKNEWAMKTSDDEYRMTTFGILQMQKEILPRIKTKIDQ